MAKRKNMMDTMDMTPVCERCGKVAPVDEKLSTPNWTVYRTNARCAAQRCAHGGTTSAASAVRGWTAVEA